MYTVNVVKGFSDGNMVAVTVNPGATVAEVASKVGAPSGCKYRLNAVEVRDVSTTKVGEGDILSISLGKADAG